MKAGKAGAGAGPVRRGGQAPARRSGRALQPGGGAVRAVPLRGGGAVVPARPPRPSRPELKASAFYNLGNAFSRPRSTTRRWRRSRSRWPTTPAINGPSGTWSWPCASKDERGEEQGRQEQGRQEQKGEQKKATTRTSRPRTSRRRGRRAQGRQGRKRRPRRQGRQGQAGPASGPDRTSPSRPSRRPSRPSRIRSRSRRTRARASRTSRTRTQAGQKPPAQGASRQEQTGTKGKGQPPDRHEVEAILDNLEKSPKALEQELARLRAVPTGGRRPRTGRAG